MSQTTPSFLKEGPVLLRPDNFTPLTRTPWGGDAIGRLYKQVLVPEAAGKRIGEAWEFSCDPAFPSRLAATGESLLDVVKRYPAAVLSPAGVGSGQPLCEILVKLLDAAEPLSLQVHPDDGDSCLGPKECGKPESWLVLAAAPGAGIYIGFSRRLCRDELRAVLLEGQQKAAEILQFVPVAKGDYFEIGPGVPHAIGPGVTLLEPQRIVLGRTGKTYRLWDWGRHYDSAGRLDPNGQARPLHLDAALPLVDPDRQVGEAFVATLRRRPRVWTAAGVSVQEFPANAYYQTLLVDLAAGACLRLAIEGGYGALIMLDGETTSGGQRLVAGQPALLPYAALPLAFTAVTRSTFAVIVPAAATVKY